MVRLCELDLQDLNMQEYSGYYRMIISKMVHISQIKKIAFQKLFFLAHRVE